jgi:hypothetical protein
VQIKFGSVGCELPHPSKGREGWAPIVSIERRLVEVDSEGDFVSVPTIEQHGIAFRKCQGSPASRDFDSRNDLVNDEAEEKSDRIKPPDCFVSREELHNCAAEEDRNERTKNGRREFVESSDEVSH